MLITGYNWNSAIHKDFVSLASFQTSIKALSTQSKYTMKGWTLLNNFGIPLYLTECRLNFAADAVCLYSVALLFSFYIDSFILGCLHFNCCCAYPPIFHNQYFSNFHFFTFFVIV